MIRTEQEIAWEGELGNEYNKRAPGCEEANGALFRKALSSVGAHVSHHGINYENQPGAIVWAVEPIETILELGAGTGANVRALERLYPKASITAVELNSRACAQLQERSPAARVINANALRFEPLLRYDLVLTKGLLIHVHPDDLCLAYETIWRAAKRWILLAEYYNPTIMGIPYRGQDNLLWKGDYAGDMLALYPSLRLVDYGFVYHRDPFPQDDVTWFLLERMGA